MPSMKWKIITENCFQYLRSKSGFAEPVPEEMTDGPLLLKLSLRLFSPTCLQLYVYSIKGVAR